VSAAVVKTPPKKEKKTEPPPCLDADTATRTWPPSSSPRAGVVVVASGGGLPRLERGWGWGGLHRRHEMWMGMGNEMGIRDRVGNCPNRPCFTVWGLGLGLCISVISGGREFGRESGSSSVGDWAGDWADI
jgi:hypothetical protein